MTAHCKSKFPDSKMPEMTITEYLFSNFKNPDKPAYIDGVTGRQYTFREFRANMRLVGSALTRLGFKARDSLLFFSTNNIDYPLLFHSVIDIGGISTTCNPLYKTDELVHQLDDGEAIMIVTEKAFLPVVRDAMKQYKRIEKIILFDGDDTDEDCISFSKFLEDDGKAYPENVKHNLDDLVIMPYSSGTTGRAKGVKHSHRTLVAGIAIIAEGILNPMPKPDDLALCVVPMYHILGLGIYGVLSLYSSNTVVVLNRFTPDGFLKAIAEYKVTALFIVPPIALFLAKHPLVEKYDLSSLRLCFSAAAALGQEVMDQAKKRLGFDDFRQLYGMTEVLATHGTPPTGHVAGSVGILVANNEVKICNTETGTVCNFNEHGEICVRGPQVMMGYNKRPEETARTIDEERWLHTGDIGYLDEDGNLFIVDRLKELIKYNAYQVPPAELENVLLQHPAVADSAVIGVPDPSAGELPRAFIVLKAGKTATVEEIQEFIAERVAPQKKLRGGVVFVDSIPKSPSGKILRRILKDQVKAELASQKKE